MCNNDEKEWWWKDIGWEIHTLAILKTFTFSWDVLDERERKEKFGISTKKLVNSWNFLSVENRKNRLSYFDLIFENFFYENNETTNFVVKQNLSVKQEENFPKVIDFETNTLMVFELLKFLGIRMRMTGRHRKLSSKFVGNQQCFFLQSFSGFSRTFSFKRFTLTSHFASYFESHSLSSFIKSSHCFYLCFFFLEIPSSQRNKHFHRAHYDVLVDWQVTNEANIAEENQASQEKNKKVVSLMLNEEEENIFQLSLPRKRRNKIISWCIFRLVINFHRRIFVAKILQGYQTEAAQS